MDIDPKDVGVGAAILGAVGGAVRVVLGIAPWVDKRIDAKVRDRVVKLEEKVERVEDDMGEVQRNVAVMAAASVSIDRNVTEALRLMREQAGQLSAHGERIAANEATIAEHGKRRENR